MYSFIISNKELLAELVFLGRQYTNYFMPKKTVARLCPGWEKTKSLA
jgi:hypothetical protein